MMTCVDAGCSKSYADNLLTILIPLLMLLENNSLRPCSGSMPDKTPCCFSYLIPLNSISLIVMRCALGFFMILSSLTAE